MTTETVGPQSQNSYSRDPHRKHLMAPNAEDGQGREVWREEDQMTAQDPSEGQ